jgi:hypothetical protein
VFPELAVGRIIEKNGKRGFRLRKEDFMCAAVTGCYESVARTQPLQVTISVATIYK